MNNKQSIHLNIPTYLLPQHLTTCFTALLLLALPFASNAAPKADYWVFWDKHDSSSQFTVDHAHWDNFLKRYISEDQDLNMYVLDYRKVTKVDKKALKNYLKSLQALNPRSYNRNEQFAYWVNLYNALTVDLILDNYPVASIRKIGGWFGLGPWDSDIAKVAGKKLTLNDIEHRILRPIWKDNRIHYAVNCASISCPDLFPAAWVGSTVETMLEQAARRYARQRKGIELNGNKLKLSSIYNWYRDDFGNRQQLLKHLARYAPKDLSAELAGFKGDIEYRYNWSLNQKP